VLTLTSDWVVNALRSDIINVKHFLGEVASYEIIEHKPLFELFDVRVIVACLPD